MHCADPGGKEADMPLKYNPYTELAMTRARLDRLFGRDNFWETVGAPGFDWAPASDIVENDAAIAIRTKLTGLEAKDVAVTVDGNVLSVNAERQVEKEPKARNNFMAHTGGAFGRSFVLPGNVDAFNIKAEFKDGLLTLTLPKKGAEDPRAIAVTPP
jgi:HSP20 family protein